MSLQGENGRAYALENLKALERLGTEPELARALDTALENSFGGEHLRRRLDETRAELLETRRRAQKGVTKHRERAERFKSLAEELEMDNKRLAEANAHLKGHYSSRRYRLVDLLANGALKMPGLKRLLRKAAPLTGASR